MKKLFVAVLTLGVALSPCTVLAKTVSVNPDDVQAPRSPAGVRSNENVRAPRGTQNVQSPQIGQAIRSSLTLGADEARASLVNPK